MNSKIHPFPGYGEGALEYAKAFRHHEGDNFVMHTDGRIFNCHPQQNGLWPIRFEVREYDPKFALMKDLFRSVYFKDEQEQKPKLYEVSYKFKNSDEEHIAKLPDLITAQLLWDSIAYLRNTYKLPTSTRPD